MSNSGSKSLEDEIRDLREKNSELAMEVQNLKILSAQKDKEKLEITKEINELRLKLSRLRSSSAAQANKLESDLQASNEEALSYIVQASGAIARNFEIFKQYMQERQELELASPKWSHVSNSNNSNKRVNEVPPLLFGGQSIQPVVSLSRTILQNRSINRSPSQNSGVTQRALPLNMLQDVYIPLTRIDAADLQSSNQVSRENAMQANNSAEELGLEDNNDQAEADESQNLTAVVEELEESQQALETIEESREMEDELLTPPPPPPPRQQQIPNNTDNPLEGPSWLLDVAGSRERLNRGTLSRGSNLEPDSTTPCDTPNMRATSPPQSPAPNDDEDAEKENAPLSVTLAFTPTVRRRKRTSSPPQLTFSPRPLRKQSTGRVLKVMVAKMRFSDEDPNAAGDSSPPKRATLEPPASPRDLETPGCSRDKEGERFDAPSPNGATDSAVIVCETHNQRRNVKAKKRSSRRESDAASRNDSRADSLTRCDSRLEYSDSDNSSTEAEGRTRRTRKQVSYKEKPLNSDSRLECSDSDTEGRTRRTRKQVSYKEMLLNRKLRR